MLRIYAKVDTCHWTRTFDTQVMGAHSSPRGSDSKGVWVYTGLGKDDSGEKPKKQNSEFEAGNHPGNYQSHGTWGPILGDVKNSK
jgi:hypothetical protein